MLVEAREGRPPQVGFETTIVVNLHFCVSLQSALQSDFVLSPLSAKNSGVAAEKIVITQITKFCMPTCQASRSIRTVSSWVPKKRTAAALLALLGN